jgi:hypothetical protein
MNIYEGGMQHACQRHLSWLCLQEKEIHKDFVKEMQHARNEGGIDTKVLACSPSACLK